MYPRFFLAAGLTILLSFYPFVCFFIPKERKPPKDLDTRRPIASRHSVWLQELTWMEVRDRIAEGANTVIVSTGGIEPTGPYLAIGKHNYVQQAICPLIARKLGNALCAPVIPFVPEGAIDPPSGMMHYPGTISLTEHTFQSLVVDVASSLAEHGFRHVILLADNGGNQSQLADIAESLSNRWKSQATSVHYIPEFKNKIALHEWADSVFGWNQEPEGLHDDPIVSAVLMTVDVNLVRLPERKAAGNASINGISLLPAEATIAAGRRILEYRAEITAKAIRESVAANCVSEGH